MISIFAPFKINLFLHAIGRRPNGYHTLQSHIMFADYGDDIIIEQSDQYHLILEGDFADTLDVRNNLVTKAVQAFCALIDKPPKITITLVKNTPVGAGLGGGSSDVATVIKALIAYWGHTPDQNVLNTLLLSLGADVPACYYGKSCWVSGIGEHITPLPCLSLAAVVIFPNAPCNTAQIFKNFDAQFSDEIDKPSAINLDFIMKQNNDLTQTALQITPKIQDVLYRLSAEKNVNLSRMSGSGSACFGICDTIEQAESVAKNIHDSHPDWWVKAVTLS